MISPRRILVVRLSALGDVLLTTPAVRALKRRFPEAEIDWLVETPYAPLLQGNPHARPLAYDKRGRHAGASGLWRLQRELEGRGYDLVVDLQAKPKTVLLRAVAGQSVALNKRTGLETVQSLLGRETPQTRLHAIDLYLEALAPLGVQPDGRLMELVVTAEMAREAASLPSGRPLVGIAPGARWQTKRWPPERFAELARRLLADGFLPLLIGGPGDAAELDAVQSAVGEALPDTRKLGVGGLAAAIARCRALIAGDSGPVHIASALRVPVVALFGPTTPLRWRPLSERSEVVRLELACSPCSNHGTKRCPLGHHACMRELPVEAVVEAWRRVAG